MAFYKCQVLSLTDKLVMNYLIRLGKRLAILILELSLEEWLTELQKENLKLIMKSSVWLKIMELTAYMVESKALTRLFGMLPLLKIR